MLSKRNLRRQVFRKYAWKITNHLLPISGIPVNFVLVATTPFVGHHVFLWYGHDGGFVQALILLLASLVVASPWLLKHVPYQASSDVWVLIFRDSRTSASVHILIPFWRARRKLNPLALYANAIDVLAEQMPTLRAGGIKTIRLSSPWFISTEGGVIARRDSLLKRLEISLRRKIGDSYTIEFCEVFYLNWWDSLRAKQTVRLWREWFPTSKYPRVPHTGISITIAQDQNITDPVKLFG